jgi:4-amino-4-deoxy-L-arabinose transferase-like glycosyltransferase
MQRRARDWPPLGGLVERRSGLILFALALLLFSSGLGLRDPWPADEPRYALVAKEMVETGDWLFPRRGGELYPDEPPLFMWAVAACYLLTDSLRVAFPLPSLVAGLVTTLLVYDLTRRLWNRRIALVAGLALITIFQFTLQAKTAQIDALLTMWTTFGLYGLIRHLLLGPAWGWYITAFASMGFGIITKGVGFLPILLLLPWGYAYLRGWTNLPRLTGDWRWLAGPAAMLGAIGIWLAPMLVTVALSNEPSLDAYRDNILWHQTAERYADP